MRGSTNLPLPGLYITPAHIYTHVHVHPLHTYIPMCMSIPYTHICTRARPTPAHIYTHVHVYPLQTYIHTCTSTPYTRIYTHAHPIPAHIYAHVARPTLAQIYAHVCIQPLHTYMHIHIYFSPHSPQQNSAAGPVP